MTTTTVSLDAFLTDAADFLRCHAPPRPEQASGWGNGSDEVPTMDNSTAEEEETQRRTACAWRATLVDAGYGWIDGPPAYGGAGLPASYARAFAALEREFDTPKLDTLLVSLRIVVPALAAHGSEAQKAEFLPGLLRGDLIACQLFSEPEAGSDLASVRTRARPRDGTWVVDGQKVWTSGGHYSQLGLLLARTDPDVPKHGGLTMFLVDMADPAVVVRPLRQMTGCAHFNEVFLDGLVVDDTRRIGDVGHGWAVTMTTLMGERQAVGDSHEAPVSVAVERLVQLAQHCRHAGQPPTPAIRLAVAGAFELGRVVEWTSQRLVEEAHARGGAGPEMSMAKLLRNRLLAEVIGTAGTMLGPAMIADTGEWGTYAWGRAAITAPGLRLGGGTDEIQRNILAERVLGLPRNP